MSFAFETPRHGAIARLALQLAHPLPTLATERLILRATRVADFDAFAEIACSPRGRHLGGPISPEDAWADFAEATATWLLQGRRLWTIGHAGRTAGFVLLGVAPDSTEPDLAVLLTGAAEGRGLAFEAGCAARTHAFEALGWPTLVSTLDPDNARAAALARRLGGYRDGRLDGCDVWRYDRAGGAT